MNTNPYLEQMAGHDTHERLMARLQRVLTYTSIGLFLLLVCSLATNLYQLRQIKEVHHIVAIDEHGRPVTTLLRHVDDIGPDDPLKQLIVRRYVMDWVTDLRARPMDKQFLSVGLNTALQQTAGPALVKFQTAYTAEDPWKRIKTERVEVKLKGQPIRLTPSQWQAEWTEEITDQNGHVIRTDTYTGRFQVAEQKDWASATNSFGLRIADWDIQKIEK